VRVQAKVSKDDRAQMVEISGDRCWICLKPERVENRSLAVDHDHQTGQVRGLLCGRCNQTIGRMEDNWGILRRAYLYVRRAWNQYCRFCPSCQKPCRPLRILAAEQRTTLFAYACCGKEWETSCITEGVGGAATLDSFWACWVPPDTEDLAEGQCITPWLKAVETPRGPDMKRDTL